MQTALYWTRRYDDADFDDNVGGDDDDSDDEDGHVGADHDDDDDDRDYDNRDDDDDELRCERTVAYPSCRHPMASALWRSIKQVCMYACMYVCSMYV